MPRPTPPSLLSLLLLISPAGASAEASAPSALQRPYRLPPPPLPPAEESPSREPDEIPRRQFEIVASTGAFLPRCAAPPPVEVTTPDPCAHLGPGLALGLAALFRPTPHLALGGSASRASFAWDAGRGLGPGAGAARASFTTLTVLGRGYLRETGVMDAYVGASVGVGMLALSAERDGAAESLNRESLVMGTSVGLEFWLSSHLRVGPEAEFGFQPSQALERCSRGVCLDASGVVARSPSHAFRLGATITLAAGDEL